MPGKLALRPIRQLPRNGIGVPPGDARPLSRRPVRRAVAVFEPGRAEGATGPAPLYVLDTDGTWAVVDVVDLGFTRDVGGNRADPLRPTAISPDGRRIAVAQTDVVLVVDVTTGGVDRIPLPGYNEQVLWHSDDVVLVTHDTDDGRTATYAVRWQAKTAQRVVAGLSVWNTVAARSGGAALELRGQVGGESGDEPFTLTEWRLDAPDPLRRTPVDFSGVAGYRITEWYGPALGSPGGDLVVRSGWAAALGFDGVEAVAVVDARTGVVRRLLDFGRGDRWKGCCWPLGWADGNTVLLRTEPEGLIAWDLRTGRIALVGPVARFGIVALNLA